MMKTARTVFSRPDSVVLTYELEDGRAGTAIVPGDTDMVLFGERLGSPVAQATVIWPKSDRNQSGETK